MTFPFGRTVRKLPSDIRETCRTDKEGRGSKERKGEAQTRPSITGASSEPVTGHRARGKKGRVSCHLCAEEVGDRTGAVREGCAGFRQVKREASGFHGQRPVGWRARRPE